jgi:multidrug efflux pump subunit AcrA (membrane-fusion protein)
LLLTLYACGNRPASHKPAAPRVDTVIASTGTVRPSETLAGVIAPAFSVAVQSTLAEQATLLAVKEGEFVRSGQLLAQLDTADLRATLAADLATAASYRATTSHTVYQGSLSIDQGVDALRSAQSALTQARVKLKEDDADLARYQALVARGYVSRQQVDQQQTTVRTDEEALRSAQAALEAARSNVRDNGTLTTNGLQLSSIQQSRATEQVALAQAEQERIAIRKATITSPIDGIVVNRNFNIGEYPGTRQLFTIQHVDPIYAILHGSGAQIAHIEPEAPASIVVDDLRKKPFVGKVVAVLNQIVPGSTDFEVKVLLPNHDRKLRPGMAIEGTADLPELRGIRIPETAFTDDTHAAVLAVDEKNIAHTARVSEIGSDGKNAVVSGIAPGTRVVANGQVGVNDGELVNVR